MGVSVDDRTVPPVYGDDEHRRAELPGSRVLVVREVRESDAPDLVALYAALGDDDLYRRFFSAHPPPKRFVEQMTKVGQRRGLGLVALIQRPGDADRLVGEAFYEMLPDGNGELGITVAADARGWVGPYLLDALLEGAAARGVPNVEADVLVTNQRMLTMLRHRGLAILGHDEQPAIVRVVVATAGRVPSWPASHRRPRLLLEVPSGRWRAEQAARSAGFEVVTCPGPLGRTECPALRGQPCPLAAGADVIVDAVGDEPGRQLLDSHRRRYPSVPVCIEFPADADDDSGALRVPRDGDVAVVEFLQRLAGIPDKESGHEA